MYDHQLFLISETMTEDEWGNQVPGETKIPILCDVKSIGRQEFYAAAQSNLRPEVMLKVHSYEYSGETKVEFEGRRYSVLRTYQPSFEELELVCGAVIGNG